MADDREEDHISDMGCHFTWAELSRTDRLSLSQERHSLLKETLDYVHFPSKTISVCNLLGFIDYSLDDHEKAIERFQDVLVMDPSNVNALSCLTIIRRRQGMVKMYREYTERLRAVLCTNDPEVIARAYADRAFATRQFQQDEKRFTYMAYLVKAMEKSKGVADGKVEKAECCYDYAECLDRKDVQHVQQIIRTSTGVVHAEAVLRDAVRSFYQVIIHLLSTRPIHPCVGRAWAKLGRLLIRLPGRNFRTILPQEKSLYGITAQDCFNKALAVGSEDAEVLGIVGSAYPQLKRHGEALEMLTASLQSQESHFVHRQCGLLYLQLWQLQQQEARQTASSSSSGRLCSNNDLSLSGTPAEQGGHTGTADEDLVLYSRTDNNGETVKALQDKMEDVDLDEHPNIAMVILPCLPSEEDNAVENNHDKSSDTQDIDDNHGYVVVNERQLDGQKPSDDQHEKGLLLKAKESFRKAIELRSTHVNHSDLGYVMFLIGEELHRSIQHFSIAMRYPQGDDADVAQTRARWVDCLDALGEHEGAEIQRNLQRQQMKIDSQQLLSTLEESWKYTHGINCQGYECDVARHNYCAEERPGYVNILSELKNPVMSPQMRFSPRYPGEYKYDFFVSFAHIDYKWAIALVQKLEKDFPGVRGILRYRDYELGVAIADNIVNSIENSYRTLVILSPDSLRDHWCRYEVQRAHMTNLTRSCAIPILLRPCRIPREIEHLSVIKCDQGQFRIEEWQRLGKAMQQSGLRG